MKKNIFILSALFIVGSAQAAMTKYTLDGSHSSVGFKVKHLMISSVKGKFEKFSGELEMDPAKVDSLKGTGVAETKSINTSDAKRDEHLRSPDFFDAEKYPELKLVVKKISNLKGKKGKMEADLTIRDKTKTVNFDYEFGGAATDPWGNKKIAFSASAKISRKDFGLSWNKTLETGGVVVGDEVTVDLEVEANADK